MNIICLISSKPDRQVRQSEVVEVVGGVQSSCTAKQAKDERGGESLPKKDSCWLPKKIEQLLPNIEVVDRRPEVVVGK